jgi:N-acyl amino acid synthase of PEP-CTERM/exosortase system
LFEESPFPESEERLPPTPQHASRTAEETLHDRFNRHFRVAQADTLALIGQAQEIRYQVYCVEHGFENPNDHPDKREKDGFDAHSVHSLLIYRSTGQALGTVRLVLPRYDAQEESFAIQRLTAPSILASLVPVQTTAEVSRFSISKQFRYCTAEILYGPEGLDLAAPNPMERRTGPLMSLGLIQSLVSMSAQHGITHWCALMEPKLLRMLAAMAIHFRPIGGPVEYHGLRQPCYCHIESMLEHVKAERPLYWQILTDAGAIGRCLPAVVQRQ